MSKILGCYSDERLFSTTQPLCPWGVIETDRDDPGHQVGKGLFHRNGLEYPTGAIHVGLWKFEEAEDYKFLIGDKLLGFEANPDIFSQYSKITCDLYGFHCWNMAISSQHNGYQTDFYAPDGREDCGGFFSRGKKWKVWETSLDKCLETESELFFKHNFLNIDAEGSELNILKGSVKLLEDIDYIVLETSTNDRYSNNSTLAEISIFLTQWDFELVEAEDGLYNDRGWGDCFFAKRIL